MRKAIEKVSAFVAVVGLAVVVLACKKGEGGDCFQNKNCKDDLVCHEQKCMTLSDARKACGASSECKFGGSCNVGSVAAEDTAICAAKTDDDCKDSVSCTQDHRCHAVNGRCAE
jgi:hypothetical protein